MRAFLSASFFNCFAMCLAEFQFFNYCPPRPRRDAARLACVCRRLRALVRNHSCWPLHEAGGAILPPLSGLCHLTVDPSGGWAGLKEALASCPEGGSVLAKEGEYVYGPGDMERQVDEEGDEYFAALSLTSPFHLFGRGKVLLKPADAPPFADWGIDEYSSTYCIISSSPCGTLDGLLIEAPRGTTGHHWTYGVGIWDGGLRLQSCIITAPKESGGLAVSVACPSDKPAIVGCKLRGGVNTVEWSGEALGRLEWCTISGAREVGLLVDDPSTAPLVANNTFRGSRWGIHIENNVDSEWALGEGNTFENMMFGDVRDLR